jgi:hypothetical protein
MIKDFFVSNPREHSDMISGRLVQLLAILHHAAIDMDVAVHNALCTNRLGSISHGLGMVIPTAAIVRLVKLNPCAIVLKQSSIAVQDCWLSVRAKAWRSGTAFLLTCVSA